VTKSRESGIPFLSICITTRNRASYIGETLESILRQCDRDVEVVIVDGASTDNTVEVIGRYLPVYACLRLITPENNSGVDADFDKAVTEARGTYCWLFSDDDLMEANAIERVVTLCRTSSPTVAIIDASVHTADFGEKISERRLARDGRDVYFEQDGALLFSDCIKHLSFIGAVVVRREFWLARNRERYFGSEFVHCGVLFQAPIPGETRVLREPLVKIRYGIGSWTPRSFEVWEVKWPRLLWSFAWIDALIIASVAQREPWRRPMRLMANRAARRYGWKQFRELVIRESDNPVKLIAPLVCAALPRWCAYLGSAAHVRWSALRGPRTTVRPAARPL